MSTRPTPATSTPSCSPTDTTATISTRPRTCSTSAKFSYEHGGLALIDYLDALRESRSVNADALNAYQQTWLAIHQLSFVTATDLIP